MRISTLARLSSLTLLLMLTLLTASVIISLKLLSDSFSNSTSYQDFTLEIKSNIERPANQYLSTGNAAQLTELEQGIQQALNTNTQNQWLDNSIRTQVEASLNHLSEDTLPQLRSAGKLTEPQALLINNERELAYSLKSVSDYARQYLNGNPNGTAQNRALLFLENSATQLANLHHLTLLRQSYFTNPDTETAESIELHLQAMQSLTETISSQELLGIYAEAEEDPMAALMGWSNEQARTEIGEEPIAQVSSLINRYPKELENARKFTELKQQGQAAAKDSIQALQHELGRIEALLNDSYRNTLSRTYWILGVGVGLILLAAILMMLLLNRLARLLIFGSHHITQLSEGELHGKIDLSSRFEEAKQLHNALNRLQDYFKDLINQIGQQTRALGLLQARAVDSAATLEQRVSQQREQAEQSAKQMQQLTQSYQEVAVSAAQSNDITLEAGKQANMGHQRIISTSEFSRRLIDEAERTESSIKDLRRDTLAIGEVLNVIQGFAEQTNLLALNAAIEAARAGTAGRGFAVVADEVRNLANNTASSAEQIQKLINTLNTTSEDAAKCVKQQKQLVDSTVEAISESRDSMELIRDAVNQITEMNAMIAAATEEQSATTSDLQKAIDHSAELAIESAAGADNNKQLALEMDNVSKQLDNLVLRFHQDQ